MTPALPLFGAGLAAGQAAPEPQPGGGTNSLALAPLSQDLPQRLTRRSETTTSGGGTNPKQKRSGYARDPLDWYCEPAFCTELLIDVLPDWEAIWDPCCGRNTIVHVFREHDIFAWGSDIAARGFEDGAPIDFLTMDRLPAGLGEIVFNPPYSDNQAETFVHHALELPARKVAALVRLDFLASQRRHALFTEHPPAYVLVLSRRPSMPPGELLMRGEIELDKHGNPKGGQHDFVWVVWSRDHQGPTEMRWLK